MARQGVVVRLALVVAALGVGWAAGACTRCDVDCSAPSRVEVVVAEVQSIDPGIVHVRTEDGTRIDVRVFGGSPDDLDDGASYRFPLVYFESTATATTETTLAGVPPASTEVTGAPLDPALGPAVDEPAAFFPDDCDCTSEYIADLDGVVIDPGVDVPFRRLSLSFIALSMLAAMGWALARWQKGEPL